MVTIFGAGPALGASVARRFATDGHDVTLIARDPAKLDTLAAELRRDGAVVATHRADLTDATQVRGVLEELRGTPDVVVYSPGDVSRLPVGVLELDAPTLASWLPLNLTTPLTVAHALVPAMVDRGSGAFVAVQGTTARDPLPDLASTGVPQAALRGYLLALHDAVADRGVYVGTLMVGALIERSAAAALFADGHFDGVDAGALPRVDPDDLAERIRELVATRGPAELAVS